MPRYTFSFVLFLLLNQFAEATPPPILQSPTTLEVNLGPIPVDKYTASNSPTVIPHCTAPTVRDCYRIALARYKTEGVRGVRFQFAFTGTANSTALTTTGTPGPGSVYTFSQAWRTNLKLFYADVYAAGIQNITPTPQFYSWQGDGEFHHVSCDTSHLDFEEPTPQDDGIYLATEQQIQSLGYAVTQDSNCTPTSYRRLLRFWPASPFATWPSVCFLRSGVQNPQCEPIPPSGTPGQLLWGSARPHEWENQGYHKSPANPGFVGWSKIFEVLGATIADAAAAGLTVSEFDLQNEVNLLSFPIYARLIHDTKHGPQDVLTSVRNLMSASGFDPGRVTVSVIGANADPASHDCGSVYGDSARVMAVSQLVAAIGGGLIGQPSRLFWDLTSCVNMTNRTLACGGSIYGPSSGQCTIDPNNIVMLQMPATHSQPNILDIHTYPCVSQGLPCPSQTPGGIETAAKTIFDALAKDPPPSTWVCDPSDPQFISYAGCSFLKKRGHQNSIVMVGETHSNTNDSQGKTCEGVDLAGDPPTNTVLGFNSSALAGHPTIFRPWGYMTSAGCFPFPPAPLNPANGAGPYIPSSSAPVAVSATPASSQSLTTAFQFKFADANGYQDLNVLNILINDELNGANACYLAYVRSANDLYLVADGGPSAGLVGPIKPGNASIIQNSQCKINGSYVSTSAAGTEFTLNVQVDFFQSAWADRQVVFVAARDTLENSSGWIPLAVQDVPPQNPSLPRVSSISPASGTGSSQTFQVTYTATSGHNFSGAQILFNRFLDGISACYVGWNSSFGIVLVKDDGVGTMAVSPNGASNSQCAVLSNSSVAVNGSTLTFTLNVQFAPGFVGSRVAFVGVQTSQGGNSGWDAAGIWSVP